MRFRKFSLIFFTIIFTNIFVAARDPQQITSIGDTIKSIYLPPLRKVVADSVINYGKLFLNTPYRYGACGVSNFDCSGFTSHVFRNFGYNLNRSSAQQAEQFPTIDKAELKPGDLVFFNGRRRNGQVGHVGIVVETHQDGDFDFIHASVSNGVVVSNSNESYYNRRYVKAARVLPFDSLLQVASVSTPVNRDEFVSIKPAQKIKKIIPAVYHSVKSGENLTVIAKRYGLTVAELKDLNNLKKNKITAKQSLKIKEAEQISIMEPMTAQNSVRSVSDSVGKIESAKLAEDKVVKSSKHLIKKGETLFSIAKLYQINIDDLKSLNKLTDSKIVPGKELILFAENNVLSIDNQVEGSSATVAKKIDDVSPKIQTVRSKQILNHRVSKGETLSSISKKYNLTANQLKVLNQLDNNKIMVGQVLNIVPEELTDVHALESTKIITQTPTKPAELIKHKVVNGESLYSIAKKYKLKVNELMVYNNLSSSSIQKGQYIRIPKM